MFIDAKKNQNKPKKGETSPTFTKALKSHNIYKLIYYKHSNVSYQQQASKRF